MSGYGSFIPEADVVPDDVVPDDVSGGVEEEKTVREGWKYQTVICLSVTNAVLLLLLCLYYCPATAASADQSPLASGKTGSSAADSPNYSPEQADWISADQSPLASGKTGSSAADSPNYSPEQVDWISRCRSMAEAQDQIDQCIHLEGNAKVMASWKHMMENEHFAKSDPQDQDAVFIGVQMKYWKKELEELEKRRAAQGNGGKEDEVQDKVQDNNTKGIILSDGQPGDGLQPTA